MTHTIITDDRRLEIENAVNRCVRHCRIVNVRVKAKLRIPIGMYPQPNDSEWWRYPYVPTISTPNTCLPTSGGYVPVSRSDDILIIPFHGVIM